MSKEAPEHGLVTKPRAKYDRVSTRAEERVHRGRFVPDALDMARLRHGYRGAARRLT